MMNNMEKTRVKKGEKYWFIFRTKGGGFVVNCKIEESSSDDNARFDIGNYFFVKEEALFMARKLRAVLKGADVIKMPSDEEFDRIRVHESLNMYDEETNGKAKGWKECFNWIKSKIIN